MRSSAAVRTVMGLVVVGGMAIGSSVANAASENANLGVNANVNAKCTISTAAVAFGDYDPVGTHASADLDAAGSVTISCTKNAVATIGLGNGSAHDGTNRRMSGGGEYLAYELFTDAGRSSVWDDNTGKLAPGAAPSKAPRVYPVYGRVFSGQDVPAAGFTDTVVATVNF